MTRILPMSPGGGRQANQGHNTSTTLVSVMGRYALVPPTPK